MSEKTTEQHLQDNYVCTRCSEKKPIVARLAMAGEGWGRWFDAQTHRYAFVSCENCGFTEVYNIDVLEGKDNLGNFLQWMFSG